MGKKIAREINKPSGAPTRDDHKQQRKREKNAREISYMTYGTLASFALIALVAYFAVPPERAGVCGDGLCGYDETGATCPADCKGSCGDGFCSMGEACQGAPTRKPGVEECFDDCGECDASNALASAECSASATGLTAAHNASLFWGTYRPHLFNGIRTRSTRPILVGLMWHSPTALDPLRYETTSNGIKSFGWQRHDGRSFGLHNVKDSELGVELNSSFIKDWPSWENGSPDEAPKGGGDWALRIKVSPLASKKAQRGGARTELSIVLHFSSLGKKSFLSEPTLRDSTSTEHKDGEPLASFTGTNPATGDFAITCFVPGEGGKAGKVTYFGGRHKREHVEQADDVLKNVYRYFQQQNPHATQFALPNEVHDSERANSMYLQITVPIGSEIDIVYTSFNAHAIKGGNGGASSHAATALAAAQGLSGAQLVDKLERRLHAFNTKFDSLFGLGSKSCRKSWSKSLACGQDGRLTNAAIEVGMVALSQVMGGMAYLDGTWFKAEPPFYNTSSEQPSVVSFSATPCRDGFARGFLWDEGFHQLIISRWDPAISRDVLLHWFALMQADGWIPREQFIGGETRRRIEQRWWAQNPTHANPPTLLLALEVLIENHQAPDSFLRCMAPKVKVWLDWFKRTQRAPALYSFKWSGRQRTEAIWHTLSSGLDDYPRANGTSVVADRHVDLHSWIIVMHRVLIKAEKRLVRDTSALESAMSILANHLEPIYWNNSTRSFADRGYIAFPNGKGHRVDFVDHHGYVSIFPVILDVLPQAFSESKREDVVAVLKAEKFLMSKAGLRSLAPTAPTGGRDLMYGTQEDYWRGKVWININYLALTALFRRADASSISRDTYQTLRANIADTITAGFLKHGYLFEQYDDKTREGLKHKPFAGWTALVLLILAELY